MNTIFRIATKYRITFPSAVYFQTLQNYYLIHFKTNCYIVSDLSLFLSGMRIVLQLLNITTRFSNLTVSHLASHLSQKKNTKDTKNTKLHEEKLSNAQFILIPSPGKNSGLPALWNFVPFVTLCFSSALIAENLLIM